MASELNIDRLYTMVTDENYTPAPMDPDVDEEAIHAELVKLWRALGLDQTMGHTARRDMLAGDNATYEQARDQWVRARSATRDAAARLRLDGSWWRLSRLVAVYIGTFPASTLEEAGPLFDADADPAPVGRGDDHVADSAAVAGDDAASTESPAGDSTAAAEPVKPVDDAESVESVDDAGGVEAESADDDVDDVDDDDGDDESHLDSVSAKAQAMGRPVVGERSMRLTSKIVAPDSAAAAMGVDASAMGHVKLNATLLAMLRAKVTDQLRRDGIEPVGSAGSEVPGNTVLTAMMLHFLGISPEGTTPDGAKGQTWGLSDADKVVLAAVTALTSDGLRWREVRDDLAGFAELLDVVNRNVRSAARNSLAARKSADAAMRATTYSLADRLNFVRVVADISEVDLDAPAVTDLRRHLLAQSARQWKSERDADGRKFSGG